MGALDRQVLLPQAKERKHCILQKYSYIILITTVIILDEAHVISLHENPEVREH